MWLFGFRKKLPIENSKLIQEEINFDNIKDLEPSIPIDDVSLCAWHDDAKSGF